MLKKQTSDVWSLLPMLEALPPEDAPADQSIRGSHAVAGTLEAEASAIRVCFLDVDGVIAPRINAGQVVKQCFDGILAACRLADARIVLTSSWRLLPGKFELLDDIIARFHGGGSCLYDVAPDLRGSPDPDPEVDNSALLPPAHLVRVSERTGLARADAARMLRALRGGGDVSAAEESELDGVFSDPDYDLLAYSEERREYERNSFSPRSREGHDFANEACSALYARTRCREVERCEDGTYLAV